MRACKLSAPFDPIWPHLAPLALLTTFGPVRPFLALFCPVWPHLAPFDSVWHHLAPFGPARSHVFLLGHSSILISRYFKVPIRQGVLFPSPCIYEYSYSLPIQNYEQSCSLPLLNNEQSYSSSVQIYEQGVQLFQISEFVMLISFNGGVNLKN